MAVGVLIIGGSGTGKSTSAMNLDPNSTVIIQCYNKPLPFSTKNYPKDNIIKLVSPTEITKVCRAISDNAPHIKRIIVDDAQYSSASEFMGRVKEKGFDKFTDIAKGIWDLGKLPSLLREDLIIYQLSHDEEFVDSEGFRRRKAKTLGKLIDEKVTLEGLYTIVLYTDVKKTLDDTIEYNFVTQNIGNTTAKSPLGMFEQLYLPNDLSVVDNIIRNYYSI